MFPQTESCHNHKYICVFVSCNVRPYPRISHIPLSYFKTFADSNASPPGILVAVLMRKKIVSLLGTFGEVDLPSRTTGLLDPALFLCWHKVIRAPSKPLDSPLKSYILRGVLNFWDTPTLKDSWSHFCCIANLLGFLPGLFPVMGGWWYHGKWTENRTVDSQPSGKIDVYRDTSKMEHSKKKNFENGGGVLFESLLQSITSVEVYACLRPSRCLCAGLSRGGYDHQIVRADLKDDGGSGFRVLVLFSSGKWTDECSPKTKTHRKKPVATYLQVIGYKAYMIYIYLYCSTFKGVPIKP